MAKSMKMKFKAGKAKSTKKIKENSKKGGNYGNMLWVTADSSKTVRMLVEPKDWDEYQFVVVEKTDDGKELGFKGKLPLFEGVEETVPEAGRLNPRVGYVIPVVVIEDGKPQDRIMFWEPGKKMLNELLTIFEKRKTLTDRDVEIIREGSGRDTTYTLYWDDAKKRSKVLAMLDDKKAPQFADELVTMVNDFMALYAADGDEDDEPKKGKKSKGKSAAAKRKAMEEDEDDEEEDEDSDDDSDEESEEEDEADDDEGDDDDEEEDEDGDDLPDADDIDAMEFKELKAFAKEHDIDVPAKSKTSGYQKHIKAWLEEQGEDDEGEEDEDGDDEGDDDAAEEYSGAFVLQEIDADAFTVDLVHKESGLVLETVYLDQTRDDLDDLTEGEVYKTSVIRDGEGDWMTESLMKPVAAKAKGGKKAAGKKGKGKK